MNINKIKMFAFEARRRYGCTDDEPEFYCAKCKREHTKNTRMKPVEVIESRAYCEKCGWVSC